MFNQIADRFREAHMEMRKEYASSDNDDLRNMTFGQMLGLERALYVLGDYEFAHELEDLRRKECQ